MSAPPVDPDVDLTALPYFPLLRRRLFRSEFHLKATDSEWRAGVTLWVRSLDEQPAGSLPNDDAILCRLAGLAAQRKKWRRVREMALRGWHLCDDGRLYHDTVAEVVNGAVNHRGRGQAPTIRGTSAGHTRASTKREPLLKSTAAFDEEKGRESLPLTGETRAAARATRSRATTRRPGPITTLWEGAARAADAYIARQAHRARGDETSDETSEPLLDERGTRRRASGAD